MARRMGKTRGFKRTWALLGDRVRKAGESRGFAVSRVLTHWPEIAGADIAAIARPVQIGYGRGGLGATLTVLTVGAQAPMLEMQKDRLRERINAVYGYNAIARIRIVQTAATGFAEGWAVFAPAAAPAPAPPEPSAEIERAAGDVSRGAHDPTLRSAIERLARNVLSKSTP